MILVCLCGNQLAPALTQLGSTRCHDCRAARHRYSAALAAVSSREGRLETEVRRYLSAVDCARCLGLRLTWRSEDEELDELRACHDVVAVSDNSADDVGMRNVIAPPYPRNGRRLGS